MVKYSCERCGKEFSQKSHYDSHNRRKTPCENNTDKIKALVDKAVEEKLKELKELNNKNLIVENEGVNVITDIVEQQPNQPKPKKKKIKKKTKKQNVPIDNLTLPRQQYLGNKIKYIDFIKNSIPEDVFTVCDAFSGSGIVSYELKKKYRILSNEILSSGYKLTHGLIENNHIKLTDKDIQNIIKTNPKKKTFIEDNFTDLYYTREECVFLDNLYSNIIKVKNDFKKSILFTAICRTLIRKILFAYFCHTKAIEYRNDPKRWKRNPAINRDIKEMFLEYVKKYNNCIFDNKKDNKAYNMDIFDFLDNINDNNIKIDLIYFDPPYGGTHCDYNSYYHFLETYINYWEDTKLYNKTKQPKDKLKKSDFTKKKLDDVFTKLFEKSKNIKYWLISYNSKSTPNKEEMTKLIKKYKNNVIFNEYKLKNNNGGMGLKKDSNEYLILCY